MRTWPVLWVALLVPFFMIPSPARGEDRAVLWHQVSDARKANLPATACRLLDSLIPQCVAEGAYAEGVKAAALKAVLEGEIQGGLPEEVTTRLERAIGSSPPEMAPMLHAILAHWRLQYLQENYYRLLNRTPTGDPPGGDPATWDITRIFAEIDRELALALSDRERIQAAPIALFSDVLKTGNVPDVYRPTLFDFLCNDALTFYTSGTLVTARQAKPCDLPADGPILAPAGEFLGWSVSAEDTTAASYRAVRIFQELLRFHANDRDRRAWFDADLERLAFGHAVATGDPEEKFDRYRDALLNIREASDDPEIGAKAAFLLASALRRRDESVEARRWAGRGAASAGGTIHGARCTELVRQIDSKSASIETERTWNVDPEIQVRYRNIDAVYFRLIPVPPDHRLDPPLGSRLGRSRSNRNTPAFPDSLLAIPPAYEWQADLPRTTDFRDGAANVAAPSDLKPGRYYLVSSHRADFGPEDNEVSVADVWVTRLALVLRSSDGPGEVAGLVLDAVSGDPVNSATVRMRDSAPESLDTWRSGVTDPDGLFSIPEDAPASRLFHLRHGDQELVAESNVRRRLEDFAGPTRRGSAGPGGGRPIPGGRGGSGDARSHGERESAVYRTFFFIDRSIYRPGQILRYKGICTLSDADAGTYAAAVGETLTVVLLDANLQEVAREHQCSNEYGSFSGRFTLPEGRLTGWMRIEAVGTVPGSAGIDVEEYKRPTFQVSLRPPREIPRLGETVEVSGMVESYTGDAVNGATVRYTVLRTIGYPFRIYQPVRRWSPSSESQEVARGSFVTRGDGSFVVAFPTRADPRDLEDDEPVYRYEVSAEVTDQAGETKTAVQRVSVGYTAVRASLWCGRWQNVDQPVRLEVRTRTLDGDPRAGTGDVLVYRLKQPARVHRPRILENRGRRQLRTGEWSNSESPPDLSNPDTWPRGGIVHKARFTTDEDGHAAVLVPLPLGEYRAVVRIHDRRGRKVTDTQRIRVIDPSATRLSIPVPAILDAPGDPVQPGEVYSAVWGSGYERARALVEVLGQDSVLQRYWTAPERTQVEIRQDVTERMRGGFTIRVTMIRENRPFLGSVRADVPWDNKELRIRWEHFTSELKPGARETWTAVVCGPDSLPAPAEMVAELYDASLDAFAHHSWPSLDLFRRAGHPDPSRFDNAPQSLQPVRGRWAEFLMAPRPIYPAFAPDLLAMSHIGPIAEHFSPQAGIVARADGLYMRGGRSEEVRDALAAPDLAFVDEPVESALPAASREEGSGASSGPLDRTVPRRNLDETALFLPHLRSGPDGVVRIEFTVPEALTKWRFLGLAHDQGLRSGFLTGTAVTSRDLMVQANSPRFLREGDSLEFVVKVTNRTKESAAGTVRLEIVNTETEAAVDSAFGNVAPVQDFVIPPRQTQVTAWRLSVPEGVRAVTYRVVGATERFSDGVEAALPILPRMVLVTEAMPLPMRGPGERTFVLTNLVQAAQSPDLRHQSLVVQMVSHPAWYAVMALPSLAESPHPCVEEIFNSLYANALAKRIADSNPGIRRVFDRWKGTASLDSPLLRNRELKAVLLEETPWVREARRESEARRSVGLLFDGYRSTAAISGLQSELIRAQLQDGAWPWIPGGDADDGTTLRLVTGFGRLRHLGADVNIGCAVRALEHLDDWCDRTYHRIMEDPGPDRNHLSSAIALYLYCRSFFIADRRISPSNQEAVDYFLGQASKYWMKLSSRQSQAYLALAAARFGRAETATAILRSLKEHSVTDDELGRFWRDHERLRSSSKASIETQALMIEAFSEIAKDARTSEECQAWLLKRKQAGSWGTDRATADAIYALLLRGDSPLDGVQSVEVSAGPIALAPDTAEAGTGFFEHRFVADEVRPALGNIRVRKRDAGLAWGSAYWQSLRSPMTLAPIEGTPLTIYRRLYTKREDADGTVLVPIEGRVEVGREIVIRLEVRADRDFECVHLKDGRGSGTEPVDVLSRFQWSGGLSYYRATRDAATHFYIQRLPKGVHVIEYSVRAAHRGTFQAGQAEVQCLYAPEFGGHSAGAVIEVR